ncbi:MAG: hypothetical protein AAF327_09745 [Cyanobacteria bacterium P01_A01_bin.37]
MSTTKDLAFLHSEVDEAGSIDNEYIFDEDEIDIDDFEPIEEDVTESIQNAVAEDENSSDYPIPGEIIPEDSEEYPDSAPPDAEGVEPSVSMDADETTEESTGDNDEFSLDFSALSVEPSVSTDADEATEEESTGDEAVDDSVQNHAVLPSLSPEADPWRKNTDADTSSDSDDDELPESMTTLEDGATEEREPVAGQEEAETPVIQLKAVEEDEKAVDPRRNPSKRSFFKTPLIKGGVVSVAGLLLIITVAGVMGKFQWATEGGETNYSEVPEEEPVATTDSDRSEAEYASQLALSNQQEANAAYINTQEGEPERDVDMEPEPEPPVATAPPPLRPIEVEPLSEIEQWQLAVQQWQLAAQTGSFGNPSISFQTSPQAYPTTPPQTSQADLFDPSTYNTGSTSSSSSSTVASVPAPISTGTGALMIEQLRTSNTTPGLRSTPLMPVLVGTEAEGELATDIILSADGSTAASPSDPDAVKYLITLRTPILDATGDVAIPAGDTLIAIVSNFSTQNGVVQMTATGVLHENREYSLPQGAILIRGNDGGFLVADSRGGGNGLARSFLPALFSGLGNAGDALSNSSSTIISSGESSVATNESSPSVFGEFASGAFSSLSQSLENNISRSNERASQRPDIWELGQGENVQIFVNNSFQM